MSEDDVVGTEELCKVMRGEADAPLRQIEAEFVPHRPAQPRIDPRRRRPDALDQSAENDAIGFGQAGFELTENMQMCARRFRPSHHAVGECGLEHVGVVSGLNHQTARTAGADEIIERRCQRRSGRLLEDHSNPVLVAG